MLLRCSFFGSSFSIGAICGFGTNRAYSKAAALSRLGDVDVYVLTTNT